MVNTKKKRGIKPKTATPEKPDNDDNQKGNENSGDQRNLVTDIVDFSNLTEGSFRSGHTIRDYRLKA